MLTIKLYMSEAICQELFFIINVFPLFVHAARMDILAEYLFFNIKALRQAVKKRPPAAGYFVTKM